MTLAATAVFGYAWLVPAGLYMAMWAKAENIGGGTVLVTILSYRLFAITVKHLNNVWRCPCVPVVPKATYVVSLRALERHRVINTFKGHRMEETKDNSVLPNEGSLIYPSGKPKIFLKNQKKWIVVKAGGGIGEGAPPGAGQVSLIELLCVYGYR